MLSWLNWTLSYTVDLILMINAIITLYLVSRLHWVFTLLVALGFYILFALFLYMLGCDFLSIVYLIVYLGGIMTLFLFAIMFLNSAPFLFLRERSNLLGSTLSNIILLFDLVLLVWDIILDLFVFFHLKIVFWSPLHKFISKDFIEDFLVGFTNKVDFLVESCDLVNIRVFLFRVISNIFYFFIFVLYVYFTQYLDSMNLSVFGLFSENSFLYLGSLLTIISEGLFTSLALEFILVGFIFWLAFLCVLLLLYKQQDKRTLIKPHDYSFKNYS